MGQKLLLEYAQAYYMVSVLLSTLVDTTFNETKGVNEYVLLPFKLVLQEDSLDLVTVPL